MSIRLMGAQLVPEDVGVAHRCGQLSADIGHDGSDLLIAATALERGLTVVTCNMRHFESDEPDAPLLLERELAVGEVDVDIGRKQQGFANEPQPPPGRHRIQTPESFPQPKQASPTKTNAIPVNP